MERNLIINNITVIGGGNIGTLLLADLASYGRFKLTLLTSDTSKWNKKIDVMDGNNKVIKRVEIDAVTSSISKAFKNADMIISTLPSHIYIIKTYINMLNI